MPKMTEDATELLERIDSTLNRLLRLRIEEYLEDGLTKKEQVGILYDLGFSNEEMAEITDSSEGSVRKYLSELRQEGVIEE